MEEIFIHNARAYASRHQLQLAERLGLGIHGIIFVAEDKSKAGKTAIKVHRPVEPYLRERAVYERLKNAGVSEILGVTEGTVRWATLGCRARRFGVRGQAKRDPALARLAWGSHASKRRRRCALPAHSKDDPDRFLRETTSVTTVLLNSNRSQRPSKSNLSEPATRS